MLSKHTVSHILVLVRNDEEHFSKRMVGYLSDRYNQNQVLPVLYLQASH